MIDAVIYDLRTGEVLRSICAPSDHIALQCETGESYVCERGHDDTHYVDVSVDGHPLREKLGDYTLHSLPLPCKLIIEDVEYPVTEQPESFEFDAPGLYEVLVDAGPRYVRKQFYVDQP